MLSELKKEGETVRQTDIEIDRGGGERHKEVTRRKRRENKPG